jgi:hypothetical protein
MDYEDVLERVECLASELGESESADARRVVQMVRSLREARGTAVRQELNRLSETLARRSARALPAAALARAALADLWEDKGERQRALNDCNDKLTMFGL